jgi:hypothetical protein
MGIRQAVREAGIKDFRLHDLRHHADFPIMPTPHMEVAAGGARVVLGFGIIRGFPERPRVCRQVGTVGV